MIKFSKTPEPPKKSQKTKKPEGGLEGESGIVQARLDFVRSCLGRGMFDHEVLDACEDSPHFLFVEPTGTLGIKLKRKKGQKSPRRRLRRSTIKHGYLYRVKIEWRLTVIDPKEELQKGYDRFMEAFRMAARQEDPKAMAMAQRYLAKMLGLNGAAEGASFSAEQVVAQLKAMQSSIGSGVPQ